MSAFENPVEFILARNSSKLLIETQKNIVLHLLNSNRKISYIFRDRNQETLEILAAYIEWFLTISNEKRVLFLTSCKEREKRMHDMICNILHYSNNFLDSTKRHIITNNGNTITAEVASPTSGRGSNYDLIIIDELFEMEHIHSIITGCIPVVNSLKEGNLLISTKKNLNKSTLDYMKMLEKHKYCILEIGELHQTKNGLNKPTFSSSYISKLINP